MPKTEKSRLYLPQVTLCAASSVNVYATFQALKASLSQIKFGSCLFFTDSIIKSDHPEITIVPILRLTSSHAYSSFILTRMVKHVHTSHCLVAQWDGHVIDARRWCPEFLNYDYIGASWPQFLDEHDVGNGGFSLRSQRLMLACRNPDFQFSHPEDVAIGRINRVLLERLGMRFANRELADCFASERSGNINTSFGYHGAWLMPNVLGAEGFWDIYKMLDDRTTIRCNFYTIMKKIFWKKKGLQRSLQLAIDQCSGIISH